MEMKGLITYLKRDKKELFFKNINSKFKAPSLKFQVKKEPWEERGNLILEPGIFNKYCTIYPLFCLNKYYLIFICLLIVACSGTRHLPP